MPKTEHVEAGTEPRKRKRIKSKGPKSRSAQSGDTKYVYISVFTVILPGYSVGTIVGWELVYTLRNDSDQISIPFMYIGAIMGAIIASIVMYKFGRNICLWFFFWFLYLHIIVHLCTENYTARCIFRFFSGMSVGAYYLVVPVYIAELVYRLHRGIMVMAVGCMIALGTNASANSFTSTIWLIMDCIIGFVYLIMKIFHAPETPYFDVALNNYERALNTLEHCRVDHHGINEIREITVDVAGYPPDPSNCLSFAVACCDLNIDYLHRTVTSIGLLLFSEIVFVSCHGGVNRPFNSENFIDLLIIYAAILIAFVVHVFTIDKYGRRLLLFVSSTCMTLCNLVLFALYCASYGNDSSAIRIMHALLVCSYYLGLDFIPFLYFSEIFPYMLRGPAHGFILFTYFLVKCFLPVANFYLLIYVPNAAVALMYFFITLASVFFCWFIPTETKRNSLCAIQIKMDGDVRVLERSLNTD